MGKFVEHNFYFSILSWNLYGNFKILNQNAIRFVQRAAAGGVIGVANVIQNLSET
jgi:hypothetical protein